MAQTSSSYSILPIDLVIELISSLEDLQLSLFFKIVKLPVNGSCDPSSTNSLCTIFRHNDNWMRYIITVTSEVGSTVYPSVQFIAVNYGADGTLLQSYLMSNAVEVPVTVIRSQCQIYWRSQFYSMNFGIPQVDRLREIKQSVVNCFVFPSLTYVLFGKLVFNFTYVEQFYTVTYVGEIEYDTLKVLPLTYFDWLDGTLCGKLDSQLFFCWSDLFFAITNQYPDIFYVNSVSSSETQSNLKILIGGYDNYMITNRIVEVDPILIKATYAHKLSVQSDEILGTLVDYTPLKEFIPITGTSLYILSFSNVLLKGYQAKYAVIGTTTFQDTNFPIHTYPATIQFVETKDPSFSSYGTVFVIYYKYDQPNNILFIYEPGFSKFLRFQNGNVILSDLIPYSLGEKFRFDAISNDTTEFYNRPNRKLLSKPTNNTYVPSLSSTSLYNNKSSYGLKASYNTEAALDHGAAASYGCHPRESRGGAALASYGCHPREASSFGSHHPREAAEHSFALKGGLKTQEKQKKQQLSHYGIETIRR